MIRQKLIVAICTLAFCVCISAQPASDVKEWIAIPKAQGVVSIIYQPDAPVSISQVQLLTNRRLDFPKLRYSVRNLSGKDIRSISVEFHQVSNVRHWGRNADNWTDTTGGKANRTVLIAPRGVYENMKKPKLLPDTSLPEVPGEMEMFKLKTFWVGFVKEVVFNDGSKYEAPDVGETLSDLLLIARDLLSEPETSK